MPRNDLNSQSAVELCAGVLPVWIRHLVSSRVQSEAAVHTMLQAFAEMDPGLRQAQQHAAQRDTLSSPHQDDGSVLKDSLQGILSPYLKNPDDCAELVSGVLRLVMGSAHSLKPAIPMPEQEAGPEGSFSETAVDRMYKGLQYQDRISQMMALLEDDMARLHKAITGEGDGVSGLADWLARLESLYAMAEQRASHAGDGTAAGGAASDETTFF